MAAIPGLSGSGGVFEQFAIWGILQQLVAPILAPIVQQVADEVYPRLPSVPLSPALVADLVLKSWMPHDPDGYEEVASSGINHQRFDAMVNDAGEPIALQMVLEAWRRGFIPWSSPIADNSVETAIKTSRVRNQWTPVIEKLRDVLVPIGDAVSAVVKGQITPAEGALIAEHNGLPADSFTILVNTAGNPPGPGELIELTRRGLIPVEGSGPQVLSLHQGIREGLTKDKWWTAFQELMVYLPPPRTVTALERNGSLTPAAAQTLYQDAGLSPTLAAVYSHNASMVKLTKAKDLAEGTVLQLYRSGTIDHAEASQLLAVVGYTAQEAGWLLSWTDLHRELAALEKAITRVSTLYISRKIGEVTAIAQLGKLGLPASQQTELLATWTLEREATVHTLTATQIADAFKYGVMTQAQAQAGLESLGYDAYDAWVVLSVHLLGPQGTAPAATGNITGQAP